MKHILLTLLLVLTLYGSASGADGIYGNVKDWLGNTITTSNGNFAAKVYVFALTGSGTTLQLDGNAFIASDESSAVDGTYSITEDEDCVTGTTCLINGTTYLVVVLYGGSHTAADGRTLNNLIYTTKKTAQ